MAVRSGEEHGKQKSKEPAGPLSHDHRRTEKSSTPNQKLGSPLNAGREINFSLENLNSNMWETHREMPLKRKNTKQSPTGDDDLASGHLSFCVDELIHPLSRKGVSGEL